MKKILFSMPCFLLLASCSSHLAKETLSTNDDGKKEEINRVVASDQAFSTQEEIKEFLDQNNCFITALDPKEGAVVYTRNLNEEIREGQKKSFFSTKSYIEDAKDNEGNSFSNIFVSQSLKDPWGEEIRIAFNFDKTTRNLNRPLFHTLFINNSPSFFRENSKVWSSRPSLVGTDFVFKLTHSQRNYAFRCDPK